MISVEQGLTWFFFVLTTESVNQLCIQVIVLHKSTNKNHYQIGWSAKSY